MDNLRTELFRNEVHAFAQVVRPDTTPFEPGYFLTFAELDDSPRIYSVRQTSNTTSTQDILYLWSNFSLELWIYFLIGLFLCTILFLILDPFLGTSRTTVRRTVNQFFRMFWNYFMLFVDLAPTDISIFKSAAVLWTLLCVAMFYAIHMILMGTLSTDLTVPVIPRSIESLPDLLYDPLFEETKPAIFRQLNMYSVLKNSRTGTDERVLFERIMDDPKGRVLEFSADRLEEAGLTALGVLGDAASGKLAVIENSQVLNILAMNAACHTHPELMSKMKPTKEVISQSVLSFLLSKQTPSSVRRFLQHKLTSVSEGSLMKGTAQALHGHMLGKFVNTPVATKGMICAEKFDHTFRSELDLNWTPLDLVPFMRLIRICAGFIALAFYFLVYEFFHSRTFRSHVSRKKAKHF